MMTCLNDMIVCSHFVCSYRVIAMIHKSNKRTEPFVSISLSFVWSFKMGPSCIYVYH